MYFVDRSVAVIKPKQPFHQWLHALPDNDLDLTLDTLRSNCNAILLPDFDEPEQCIAYLDEIYEQLFQMELAGWCEDSALWPQDRSLKAFWEWFDVEIHSQVFDSVEGDITNRDAADELE
ncbi:MAG: hypothetical protein JO171_14140 [Paludibacterium sp.]|uniref:hypothetical protein n=1 Tax=Paludibacterium sp. TaxID=1917523 RepID=UPI0025F82D20|nr:hypothetical protein [Paludibacterium sp.]MBV8048294.1 hypothetical protein [Paludibacterium sp.]MBV8646459.1 hypothetical protein [Paludibacterium sp.]